MKFNYKRLGMATMMSCICMTGMAKGFDLNGSIRYCEEKISRSLNEMKTEDGGRLNYSMVPWHVTDNKANGGHWDRQAVTRENWTCGFWAGCMMYNYLLTGNHLNESLAYVEALDTLTRMPIYDHDLGFEIYCSYGPAIQATGKEEYKQTVVRAANLLCQLYNPTVGTMLSWPRNIKMFGGHNTIMDNMINLETLFAASRITGNNKYKEIAIKHAETTMRNHFRPDYTSYHVAVYDTLSGKLIKAVTHQGYADNTMWARGQSWAIYGYTMVYRETRDPRFLDFAKKVTDVYLERLPKDMVPYWDFNDPKIPDAYRDVSAACVVASALIELQGYVGEKEGKRYLKAAEKMLKSVMGKAYASGNANSSILLHSVGNMPAGTEIDASIVYADYYLLEALYRYKTMIANK